MANKPTNLDLQIRFFDNYSRTMDALRTVEKEIEEKYKVYDTEVNFGLGFVEDPNLNHGFSIGCTNNGIYDVKDLVYNSNLKEYLIVNKFDEIKRFSWTGRPLPDPPRRPSKTFSRFIYIHLSATYVCWKPLKKGFFLAKEDFSIALESQALSPIKDILCGGRKVEDLIDFFILADNTVTRYTYNLTTNIVALQDVIELSDMEASGGTIEATCFDHPEDDRKQWMYLTYQENCSIVDVTGRFHGTKKNLHPNKITAIMASNNSDFVVTGDAKGFLKLWGNRRWAFIAEVHPHNVAVSHLVLHPNGRASVSMARDEVVFSWSFDSLAKLDRVHSPEIVTRIAENKEMKSIMMQGGRKLVLWRMDILYHFHSPLSAPLKRVDLTWHPDYNQRAVAICEDNSIRIINPPTGAIITNIMVDPTHPLRQAVYHKNSEMDTMFVVTPDQSEKLEVQQWDCSVNPSQLRVTWDESMWGIAVTAIGIYDYVESYQLEEKEMAFTRKKERYHGKALYLIAGRRDGYIAQLDIKTGDELYSVKCHRGPVARIEVNNELGQFCSLGIDPSIRVWKIIPKDPSNEGLEESFVALFEISWKYPIRFLTWIRQYICFALSNSQTATHRTVIYNTSRTERHDNDKSHRHQKEIVSLSSCPELVLFCSAALDETIRIWNHENYLLRKLTLNWVPSAAGFSSKQGDLYVGIDNSIQVLPAEKYLTVIYRNRAMMANFGSGAVEPPINMEVARTGQDKRLMVAIEDTREVVEVVARVQQFQEPEDSQQNRDKEIIRETEADIRRIVEGNHPRDPDEPDVDNMTKKQWDEYVKANDDGEDGEDRKYFISRPRKDCLIKMREMKKELEDYKNIV